MSSQPINNDDDKVNSLSMIDDNSDSQQVLSPIETEQQRLRKSITSIKN